MKQNFTSNCLSIGLSRGNDSEIRMVISSDYSKSNRKSQLWVNEKSMAEDVLNLWKGISTKKLLRLNVSFGEIDYYDNMTDMYEVPTFSIERGLRKARIGHTDHGCIPKEWSIDLRAKFADTKVITPILEVVKAVLGTYFTDIHEKAFTKTVRPFLQSKQSYANYEFE